MGACRKFSKRKSLWRGMKFFFLSLLGGEHRKIPHWVCGGAPAENELGAFLASQNTFGEVLVER